MEGIGHHFAGDNALTYLFSGARKYLLVTSTFKSALIVATLVSCLVATNESVILARASEFLSFKPLHCLQCSFRC